MKEAFLFRIVTANETWVHHFEPRTKGSRTKNGIDRAYMHMFFVGAKL
jgi:hypothetical protein